MAGKLILVSGISGAGKTTLISEALKSLPALQYLSTYTTRPKRDSENEQTHEYIFVNEHEYEKLRSSSTQWDHTEYKGFYYGADGAKVKQQLGQGISVICSIAPNKETLTTMSKFYDMDVVAVWVNTPRAIAGERIKHDKIRSVRNDEESTARYFDHAFNPTGELKRDQKRFASYINKIICS